MTYWVRWKSSTSTAYDGPPVGPFTRHRDAVSRVEADMARFADDLEHAVGKPGEWTWDAARQVATLYRGDFLDETSIGSYIIQQDAPQSA